MGHKYLIAAVSLVFLATGCGKKKVEEPPPAPEISVSTFNYGYSGSIFYDSANGFTRLDLGTGAVEPFLDRGRDMSSISIYGDRIVSVRRSTVSPELQLLDRSKNIVVRISLPENPEGTPKLSRNGTYIIQGGIVGDTKIFDLSGNVVKNLFANISSYDWLADGRVLFSRFGTVYIMDAEFKGYEVFKALPGTVGGLSVSPDGSRVALSLSAETPHIFVMDLSGNYRQITSSQSGENFPSWSPSGNEIVFAKGKLPKKGKPDCLELYVVNANLDRVIDLDNESDSINSLRVQQNVSGQVSHTCAISTPNWRSQ